MKQLLKLSISDFKLMFRDASLRIFLFLPILILVVINYFLPYLISKFEAVNDYVIYVIVVATIENVQMFGFIYGMVLIDEKETEVAKVYGVLPVSKAWFTTFRFIVPMLVTSAITWAILMLQPFYELSVLETFLFSLISSCMIPVYVIGVTNLSKNRLEGMVWIKMFNIIVIIPAVAFFVPSTYTNLFGIFPSHWLFQGLYHIIRHEAFQWQLIIGFLYVMVLLYFMVQKFTKTQFV